MRSVCKYDMKRGQREGEQAAGTQEIREMAMVLNDRNFVIIFFCSAINSGRNLTGVASPHHFFLLPSINLIIFFSCCFNARVFAVFSGW